jgi:hypothetical protein
VPEYSIPQTEYVRKGANGAFIRVRGIPDDPAEMIKINAQLIGSVIGHHESPADRVVALIGATDRIVTTS